MWPLLFWALSLNLAACQSTNPVGGKKLVCTDRLTDYNLVLINIDALRADHLGSYGYSRNTSPFIDTLAAEGVTFTQAMANSSYTRESVAALLTGRLPSSSGAVGWYARPESVGLGELFRAAGYQTGFFSNTVVLKHPSFTNGFIEKAHLPKRWDVSGAGTKLSDRVIDFVQRRQKRKFALYVHYLDPHAPYNPPKQLYLRFADRVFPKPVSLYYALRPNFAAFLRQGFGPRDLRFDDMVLRYDAEISDTDRAIKRLFSGLRHLGVLNNTLVIVTADHGEEFLEHGFIEHAWTLYTESLHVPLMFWAPHALVPQRISSRVSSVDVVPTVLHLMSMPSSVARFDGSPLFQRERGAFYFTPPSKPLIAELLLRKRNVLHAIIKKDWKYIAAERWLPPLARPSAAGTPQKTVDANKGNWQHIVHEELYNLAADPAEKNNLAHTHPVKVRDFRELLRRYRLESESSDAATISGVAAMPEPPSGEDLERLRALGY